MTYLIDVHSHVVPPKFPVAPSAGARSRWPCMTCDAASNHVMMMGEVAFRRLDTRSWEIERRLGDMDRDKVEIQVLSPMPELLSYWLDLKDAAVLCDIVNAHIGEMVSHAPRRFRGLGAVPLQDIGASAATVVRLRERFGLSGIEIGSNINGVLPGDCSFNPFWEAVQDAGLAVFIHALHPIAAMPLPADPMFTAAALFPIDVAMAAASLITNGTLDRFPGLRIAFSHGGGAIGAMLGRLDAAWDRSSGFGGKCVQRPSSCARKFFYDSNVYDRNYLRQIVCHTAPGQVFLGTDYPYDIMQTDPASYLAGLDLAGDAVESLNRGAAIRFLNGNLTGTDLA